ncbi:uracil-DNA glycosylase family protein [Paludisphaera rhizosphaerae]|uniref:uracil-DNA glycosylase family protein n=1 Tax=Paludisphaera rhizosphaerae TaxID=2711216 RepID=UPI0013ED5853|nr:uracil-DNA glycosylase family protein [Paludisphaera rhizosphaerae]
MSTRVEVAASEKAKRRLVTLNAEIRECRLCHAAGYLNEADSVPIARDPEPDAPMPRILLVGQAPGLRATITDRPFAGAAGNKLRDWFEAGGIPREDFWRRIHFAAVTRCYPGRLPGAKGDRVPSPSEQALCHPWLNGLIDVIRPRIVLLVGLLAVRTFLGPVKSLAAVVGEATERDGVLYIPLPHPSGVSRWLNEPANVHAVARAMAILRSALREQRA